MKAFIDESVNAKILPAMRGMFPTFEFTLIPMAARGLDDVDLFPYVRDMGCNVYLTVDMKQLTTRPHEVRACGAAGLHWVGVGHTSVRGKKVGTNQAMQFIGGLLYVADAIREAEEPMYFDLGVGHRDTSDALVQSDPIRELTTM